MKLYVDEVAKNSERLPIDYISNPKLMVKCELCEQRKLSTSKKAYKLCIEGNKKKIEAFILYLQTNGFKVKRF